MLKNLFVFAVVALVAQAYAAKQPFIKMADSKQCLPGDTDCNNGYCCPAPYIFCCADNLNCAPEAANCPFVAAGKQLTKMAAKKQCLPGDTDCNNGYCCPAPYIFCCADNMNCAPEEANCPFVAAKKQLTKMAAKKQCSGTPCPAGCCPEANWFCCADNLNCASTEANCPFVAARKQLTKMAAKKQCSGTECPAGCCPEANWFCCADNMNCASIPWLCPQCLPGDTDCHNGYCCPAPDIFCCADNMNCAPEEANCPFVAAKNQLTKLAAKKQCSGTECPAGCCPEANWFCCADNLNCASTEANCPFVAAKKQITKMAAKKQCLPGDTDCNNGYCCPAPYIFCCADNMNCAPEEANCPFVAAGKQLTKMAAKKQCLPGDTDCNNGYCCPAPYIFCCADNMNCAPEEANCPFVAARQQLTKMAAKKQCSGTECPAGCCPEANWFCCADNLNCASTEANCPFYRNILKLN